MTKIASSSWWTDDLENLSRLHGRKHETAKHARQILKEPDRPIWKSMEALKKDLNLLITFPTEKQMRNFLKIIETSVEPMNRGASDEEMEQIAKQLRQEMER
jgi:hypothetical protein